MSVAYSRDGHRLASASDDRNHQALGRRHRPGHPHPDRRQGASRRSSSTRTAPGWRLPASDQVVTLWDAATGQVIRTFPGHTRGSAGWRSPPMARSWPPPAPTGRSGSGTSPPARCVRTLEGPQRTGWYGGIAFSPDGKTLVSAGGGEPTIRFWDVATGQPVRTLQAGRRVDFVGSLAFRPDGKILASGAGDGTITIWDVAAGSPVRTLRDHHNLDSVRALAFSPDGKTLASTVLSRQAITLWDAATGHLVAHDQGTYRADHGHRLQPRRRAPGLRGRRFHRAALGHDAEPGASLVAGEGQRPERGLRSRRLLSRLRRLRPGRHDLGPGHRTGRPHARGTHRPGRERCDQPRRPARGLRRRRPIGANLGRRHRTARSMSSKGHTDAVRRRGLQPGRQDPGLRQQRPHDQALGRGRRPGDPDPPGAYRRGEVPSRSARMARPWSPPARMVSSSSGKSPPAASSGRSRRIPGMGSAPSP